MHTFHYILIVLFLSLTVVCSSDLKRFFNDYMKEHPMKRYGAFGKFGVSQQHLFRIKPVYHPQQQHPMQMPICLPYGWSCGLGFTPCCVGLSCFDGNAKRGRYCAATG